MNAAQFNDVVDPKTGWSVLMLACAKGENELVLNLLLDGKSNVNFVGPYGMTALMAASAMNQVEIADLLLQAGANTAATDDDGCTARGWAFVGLKLRKYEAVKQEMPFLF
jgi:ankyrin repeat protein